MISRDAESCFWLGRQLERAESLARVLAVKLAHPLDGSPSAAERWLPLLAASGEAEAAASPKRAQADEDGEAVQEHLTWEPENPYSIASVVRQAHQQAWGIREALGPESWWALDDLRHWLDDRATRRIYERERLDFYLQVRDRCLLVHAHCDATMLREEPLEFIRLGAALERSDRTTRLLDLEPHNPGEAESPAETARWLTVLRYCAAVEPFFKQRGKILSGPNVVTFLLFERSFPRTVLHNLDEARQILRRCITDEASDVGVRSTRILEALRGRIERARLENFLDCGLHDFCQGLLGDVSSVCAAIQEDFFDPKAWVLQGDEDADLAP